jgi:hypothetical protein
MLIKVSHQKSTDQMLHSKTRAQTGSAIPSLSDTGATSRQRLQRVWSGIVLVLLSVAVLRGNQLARQDIEVNRDKIRTIGLQLPSSFGVQLQPPNASRTSIPQARQPPAPRLLRKT